VVAEKFHAMVDLGMANSRMKDFFDIWFLSQHFSFDGATLAAAVHATFERRRTLLPTTLPLALTPTFAGDAAKISQWTAFIKRTRVEPPVPSLLDVTEAIARMLGPLLEAASLRRAFPSHWPPGGPWGAEERTARE
jgi:hypothetical protein